MYDILLIIQYINIFGIFAEAVIIFRKWRTYLHGWLFLNCIVQLVNAAGILAQYTARTEGAYVTALRLAYLGRIWVALFLFMFVAELCGKRLPRVLKLILVAVHAGIYVTVFTIPDCKLYYTKYVFYSQGGFSHFAHTNGITHHIFTGLQICYIVAGIVMLCISLYKEKSRTVRKRLRMVLYAVSAMTVFYLIQITGLLGMINRVFDVTMIGYTVCTAFMYIAILRFDLLGMREAAREIMIDRLSEGIIAADKDGKVQYFNTPAKELYPGLKVSVDSVPEEIPASIATGGIMTINGRIFKAEERELTRGGDRFGTLYALVDETEHFHYMEALEEQKTIADSANRAKSSFLANMSHDIRTPINAVLGMNEMVLRECDDENILLYSENIRNAGNTLLGLINDILDFSKIEAGKLNIIPVDYDLASMLNDLVNMIQKRADDKGLALKLDIDENTPRLLCGDEIRVKQIITNLLTNAVKYTENGSVTFAIGFDKAEDDERTMVLNVRIADTGIGIKPEDMPKLFAEFERIEETRNRSIEGTGLGMNITQSLLAMMGSRLEVESEYGKGSVFSFALRQEVVKWEPVGNYEEAFRRSLTERKKYRESFTAPEARILVIDDTPMNLSVFRSLLKTTLMRIDTAESGDAGIKLAKTNKYDIIFIDHMMPNKDGIETLAEIKASDCPGSKAVTVCLTANAVSGAREQYLAAGFDDYLTKPVDPKRLEQMIKGYLPEEKLTITQLTDEPESPAAAMSTVLVVDDDETIRKNAESILRPLYNVICRDSGKEAVRTAGRERPDLILLDINLGGMDGFDVLRQLKANSATHDIPVMFITGDSSEESEVQGFRSGASDYVRKPFVPEVLLQRTRRVIDLYHLQSGLRREVGRQTARADRLSLEMMIALSKTVDAKDHYTNGHSGRVAEYSAEIARRMGKSEAEQEKIYEMGLMHDIGKIGVSEEIINKTSRLTDEEFAQIKKHTVIGYDILSAITEMPDLATGARSHHEKYNGTGYPDGLAGKDIPEAARIICVADCYDAMTSTRTYSTPRSQEAVRTEIERCSGTQFDPDIAAVMIQMIDGDTDYRMNERGGAKVWKNMDRLWNVQPAPEPSGSGTALPELLYECPEIDTKNGLLHCGTAETYLETVTIYAKTVNANADEIEEYLAGGDLKNAVVKIHALKSTSRVIGAMELGALAEMLEKAGNENDADTINAHIDELLTRYRALGRTLSPLTGEAENAGSDERPVISADELGEIYTAIREFMSVADYDSAADIIENLKGYRVPESEKSRCDALINAAEEVRYEQITDILGKGE